MHRDDDYLFRRHCRYLINLEHHEAQRRIGAVIVERISRAGHLRRAADRLLPLCHYNPDQVLQNAVAHWQQIPSFNVTCSDRDCSLSLPPIAQSGDADVGLPSRARS